MQKIKGILIGVFFLSIVFSCNTNRKELEFFNQGKDLYLDGKYTEAIPYFTQALRRNKSNDEAYAYRGLCYYSLEDYSNAMADFSTALNFNPQNETALFGDARIRWNLEDYKLAFLEFNQLLQINPEHDKAYFYRGRAYLDQGDTIDAMNDLSTALEIDSCYIDSYYLLAAVMTAQKKFEQADAYLERALKCKQKNETN